MARIRLVPWWAAPVLLVLLAFATGCTRPERQPEVTDGDPELGKVAIQRYGCGTCHTIPGVPGAEGRSAQLLFGFADRADIARSAPNTYKNLVTWIQNPQKLDPSTRMPSLNVTEKDARDIATYLLTLRSE
ncbi:c-type cytochrome [Chondromyces apiculatus]|uniref:c-type cytochrome n=1 Tax=Chondromyces apiculatus TaxID=51 RepID=UPI0005C711DD|nr:c-type cytochrome [Chondromyces apiculatus]